MANIRLEREHGESAPELPVGTDLVTLKDYSVDMVTIVPPGMGSHLMQLRRIVALMAVIGHMSRLSLLNAPAPSSAPDLGNGESYEAMAIQFGAGI